MSVDVFIDTRQFGICYRVDEIQNSNQTLVHGKQKCNQPSRYCTSALHPPALLFALLLQRFKYYNS